MDIEMCRLPRRVGASQLRCDAETVVLDVYVCVHACVRAASQHNLSRICHPQYLWQLFYRPLFPPALPIFCISAN